MKIRDVLNSNPHGVSFEFFPPKTEKGMDKLALVSAELAKFNPLYVSVTYGACGSSQDSTKQAVKIVQDKTNLPIMPHLTCIGASEAALKELLDEYVEAGYENIFALRGDVPADMSHADLSDDFKYAVDLIAYIKKNYNFSIGAALNPEGHPESPSIDIDVERAAAKINAGADFAITQMFFDNDFLYKYVDRLNKHSIDIPIIPGILPITDIDKVRRFADLNKTTIPTAIASKMESVADKPEEMRKIGIEFAIKQCQGLVDNGFKYLHFFALNRSEDVSEIVNALRF